MSDLQISAEPLEPRQVQLTIVVPADRVERATHEAAQRYARQLRVKGYRPGKVPIRLVYAQVGEDKVRAEATDMLTRQSIAEALRAENLSPAAPTSVEVIRREPLTLHAVVTLAPNIDLGDYRSLRLDPPARQEVSEAAVEEVIESWRRDLAYLAPVERAAMADDVVTLSLVGRDGDRIVYEDASLTLTLNADGAKAANLPTGVTEGLFGLTPGQRNTFAVTYSEFWEQPELQGRSIEFEAEVASISAVTLPELDDALAQEVGDVETLDELRERVRRQIRARAELDARRAYLEAALDALVESATVEYPPALLESEVADIAGDLRSRIERQGFTWERWLELQYEDEDEFWRQIEEQAERRLLRGLVLSEFVRAEGIAITKDQIESEVDRLTDLVAAGSKGKKPPRESVRRSAASRMLTNQALARLAAITAGETGDGEPQPDGAADANGNAGPADVPAVNAQAADNRAPEAEYDREVDHH